MEQNLKPGQIRLQRRVSVRRKFDDVMKTPITSVDDALSFIDVIEKQMPAVKKALQKVRTNAVFDNSRIAGYTKPVMSAPVHETYREDSSSRATDIQTASKIQGATDEQQRIAQLKEAKAAIESAKKPVQVPGIPGINPGERKNPQSPVASVYGVELGGSSAEALVEAGELVVMADEEQNKEPAIPIGEVKPPREPEAPKKKPRGRPKKSKK